MPRYQSARTLLAFLEVIGYGAIAIGIAAGAFLLVQSSQGGVVTALVIAGPVILAGVLVLALAEIAGAHLDTASNTAEILELMREQIRGRTSGDESPRPPHP